MADEIRPAPFSSASISAALDKALARVEPGKTVAFVAVAEKSPSEKLQHRMAVMVNLGDGWSFGGFLAGDIKTPLREAGAELRWSK